MERNELLDDLVNLVFRLISVTVDCQCMALRLKENDDFPFYKQCGHRDEFIAAENSVYNLHSGTYDCLCGQVLTGQTGSFADSSTEYGSFWSNALQENLSPPTCKKIPFFRGKCLKEGFESQAIIPIKSNNSCTGLFHITDKRKGRLSEPKIEQMESAAQYFAQILLKIREIAAVKAQEKEFRVLITDDELQIALILKKILARFGFRCALARNGLEAFEYLSQNRIDLLITDLCMPEMDGITLVKKVREKYGLYGPKIMILSGTPDYITAEEIRRLKVAAFLLKPIENIMDLPELVRSVLTAEN